MDKHHTEDNASTIKVALNLFAACLVSGFIIAGVYYATANTALKKVAELKDESMRSLIADADSFADIQGKPGWVKAVKNGATAAYIVPAESKGYAGSIKMLVAVSPEGKVLNFVILDHRETPGLGDKAGKLPFMAEITGKDAAHLEVTKDPSDREHVHAITSATITSRAVTKGIREAVEDVVRFTGVR